MITGLDQGGAEATLTRLLLGLDRNVFDQAVVLLQVLPLLNKKRFDVRPYRLHRGGRLTEVYVIKGMPVAALTQLPQR